MMTIINEIKTILSITSKSDGEIVIEVADISEDSIPTVIGILEQVKFQLLSKEKEPVLPMVLSNVKYEA